MGPTVSWAEDKSAKHTHDSTNVTTNPKYTTSFQKYDVQEIEQEVSKCPPDTETELRQFSSNKPVIRKKQIETDCRTLISFDL